jgi:hypothetical protein
VGRNNYGLRVFNGVGLLSTALALKDSSQVVVLLANYTDFPAEDITLHVMGSWDKAVLESPMGPPQNLATYPVGESTAVEVPRIHRVGLVRLSR